MGCKVKFHCVTFEYKLKRANAFPPAGPLSSQFFFAGPHEKGVTLLFQLSIEWHSDYFSQGQKFAWGVIAKGLLKMPPVDQTISDAEHLKTGSLLP